VYANYSVALSAVYSYAQAQGIPYRHVLLDSWWYVRLRTRPPPIAPEKRAIKKHPNTYSTWILTKAV
jgi:hypothetical protein